MATHSSTLAWKIPWMEEPGGLQSMGSQRVGHDWATFDFTFTFHSVIRTWLQQQELQMTTFNLTKPNNPSQVFLFKIPLKYRRLSWKSKFWYFGSLSKSFKTLGQIRSSVMVRQNLFLNNVTWDLKSKCKSFKGKGILNLLSKAAF